MGGVGRGALMLGAEIGVIHFKGRERGHKLGDVDDSF